MTTELKKREALVKQHAHKRSVVAAPSHTPVLTEYTPGTHQVSTATIVDLHVGVRTDVERSRCVPSRARAHPYTYQPDHTGLKGSTHHDHDRTIHAL